MSEKKKIKKVTCIILAKKHRTSELEKEMVTHSRTLAWKIPWREEHGRPQPMGSPRVGHVGATSLSFFQNKISLSLTHHCPHCYPSRSG